VWHLELAQRLLHVASDLAAEGNARPVRGLADRALHNANLAAGLSRKTEQQAAAKTLTGIILENYHGDVAGAARAFAEAVQLNPRANQAREKLAQIQSRLPREGGPRS
jgi:hypothetical protein